MFANGNSTVSRRLFLDLKRFTFLDVIVFIPTLGI